ncbi:hypothetical protein HZH68_003303 [Vespula germanica]|uniref:Uncharacterized protein n=1 Tax=Vespula germanica TaxID=30212 RepID=A0A834NNW2_VESGE|nr:hypothetical protein HZH68_003303 [Vespula germanica]
MEYREKSRPSQEMLEDAGWYLKKITKIVSHDQKQRDEIAMENRTIFLKLTLQTLQVRTERNKNDEKPTSSLEEQDYSR